MDYKDDLAILDILASNMYDRPIYFAMTILPEKLMGLNDYFQIEGLAMRFVPIKYNSPNPRYVFYSGGMDTDRVYNNVMNKFKWGNFDKREMFVDRSYGATQQSHRMIMMRAANELINKGQNEKAADLAEKYFEAFPEFNFPYDETVEPFLQVLIQAGRTEAAKKHLEMFAEESKQRIRFYESQPPNKLKGGTGFNQEYQIAKNTSQSARTLATQIGDSEFTNRIEQILDTKFDD